MLKQRIITAVFLAAIFLSAIFAWPMEWFVGLMVLVALICTWEWSRLCGLQVVLFRALYAIVATGLIMLPIVWDGSVEISPLYFSGVAAVFWAVVSAYLLSGKPLKSLGNNIDFWRMMYAIPLFSTVIWGLMWLRYSENGSALLLLYVFFIVWLADVGAYFAGKRWGKHKLAPAISPGKTREGFAGGMLAVALWAVLFGVLKPFPFATAPLFIASIIAGVLSVFGDLFESSLKRSVGIKDSGVILPGHGGLLDRVDSVLAAVPVFIFVLLLGT